MLLDGVIAGTSSFAALGRLRVQRDTGGNGIEAQQAMAGNLEMQTQRCVQLFVLFVLGAGEFPTLFSGVPRLLLLLPQWMPRCPAWCFVIADAVSVWMCEPVVSL